MTPADLSAFREVWLVDFEFQAPPGERPHPLCLVAREFYTNRLRGIWFDPFDIDPAPPFAVGEDALFVAYYASAELACHQALNWPMPARVLDLFVEFRNMTNGKPTAGGNGLLGALAHFGLNALDGAEKEEMRQLAMRGGLYTLEERAAMVHYCQTDVDALAKLLPAMLPYIDLPRALVRGRYMAAAARMEWNGIPLDTETLAELREHWDTIKSRLVVAVDQDFGVFVPTNRKPLNPTSQFGHAILAEAERCELDPYDLAEAVDSLREEERESSADFYQAKRRARQATGLTIAGIRRWEDWEGKDYSTWPHLDVKARELAGQYPQLGLGSGYRTEDGVDNTDYAARLWELLSDPQDNPRPRHDAELIREAADRLIDGGGPAALRPMSFNAERFALWLASKKIPWPRTQTGRLAVDGETFRQMARRYPEVAPLRELLHTLGQMRLNDLTVGEDGRNRCLLSAFRSRTGRNQPSNAKFIFGPSCWLRSLIKPEPGQAVAYVDWEQQEFGIAAALSRDQRMKDAYASGDPYLTFAKQAGAVPPNATKQSHPKERGQFKVCALAVQYGMAAQSLAKSLGEPEAVGRELLRLHQQTYPDYWRWSQAAVDHATLFGWIQTVFGWRLHVGVGANPRSLANFPCQANGAEMLRLACCLLTERGITVCAPVHDAVLIESSSRMIETTVQETQEAMREASELLLDGFSLRTDAEIIHYPDRYLDERGEKLWNTVQDVLAELRTAGEVPF